MNKYDRIKKLIYYALKDAEQEALDDGIDITSPEFESILSRLKDKLLQKLGISPAEYRQIEELEKQKKLSKKWEERTKISGEINKKIDKVIKQVELKETRWEDIKERPDIKKEITKTETLLNSKISETDKKILSVNDIKKLIPKEKEYRWTDFPEFIRDLNDVEKWRNLIEKRFKKVEEITEKKPKREFSQEEKEQIQKLISRDWFEVIQDRINDLTPRLWRGLGLGLQRQINANKVSVLEIDLSSQCDGSTIAFSLGRIVKSIIVINLEGTMPPYTLNATKNQITLTFAPDSGEELKAITLI